MFISKRIIDQKSFISFATKDKEYCVQEAFSATSSVVGVATDKDYKTIREIAERGCSVKMKPSTMTYIIEYVKKYGVVMDLMPRTVPREELKTSRKTIRFLASCVL
jgi:hypothetical protein